MHIVGSMLLKKKNHQQWRHSSISLLNLLRLHQPRLKKRFPLNDFVIFRGENHAYGEKKPSMVFMWFFTRYQSSLCIIYLTRRNTIDGVLHQKSITVGVILLYYSCRETQLLHLTAVICMLIYSDLTWHKASLVWTTLVLGIEVFAHIR